jgi:hypothetical protein
LLVEGRDGVSAFGKELQDKLFQSGIILGEGPRWVRSVFLGPGRAGSFLFGLIVIRLQEFKLLLIQGPGR